MSNPPSVKGYSGLSPYAIGVQCSPCGAVVCGVTVVAVLARFWGTALFCVELVPGERGRTSWYLCGQASVPLRDHPAL